MADFVKMAIPTAYIGASGDDKPTGVGIGTLCFAYDTGVWYVTYDGTNWVAYSPVCYVAPYLLEIRPQLEFTTISGQSFVPTTTTRGLVTGFSLPIWSSNNEELYFKVCVPNRWDGVSDIQAHVNCYLASAQSANEKAFKLQLEWEHFVDGAAVPNTGNAISVLTEDIPNPTAQFTSYKVDFEGTNAIDYNIDGAGHEILADEILYMRLRRIDKTGADTEITGELVITHVGIIFQCDKIGESA